ncbi:MAG: hypothetical protein JW837_08140 [Sedimentisphaerales bacterium]|nr:hypothetical protein [Sedimentisphaerales bacterium]
MSVLTVKEQVQCSSEFSEHIRLTIPDRYGDSLTQKPPSRLLSEFSSATQNRTEKILNIRRQLDAGIYDVNKRLNVAVDRLIENLISKDNRRK